MPTFPISSSSHFLPSSSSSSIFFISGGAPRTSTSSSHLLTPTTKTIVIFLNPHQHHHHHHHHHNNSINKLFLFNSSKTLTYYSSNFRFSVTSSNNSISDFDLPPEEDDNNNNNNNNEEEEEDPGVSDSETPQSVSSDNGVDIDIEIEKIGNNYRRIRSRISIDATLETIWGLLTDYEGLSNFIPGLSVSKLLQKGDKFARIFQIGQQNLAFGVNFNAKGIIDCYEKDLETLPFGRRRDIDFKMVEGDFQTFQGKWSIEEIYGTDRPDVDQISGGEECYTTTATVTLSYIVDVKPKLLLPVGLVEGRLCREVSLNLLCIKEEAQKTVKHTLPTC